MLRRDENRDSDKYLYTNVYNSTIHNSQEVEMPERPDECKNEKWSINTTEWYSAAEVSEVLKHADETQKQYAKVKKPDTEVMYCGIPCI